MLVPRHRVGRPEEPWSAPILFFIVHLDRLDEPLATIWAKTEFSDQGAKLFRIIVGHKKLFHPSFWGRVLIEIAAAMGDKILDVACHYQRTAPMSTGELCRHLVQYKSDYVVTRNLRYGSAAR
jgi:hypothetical protein